MSSFGVTDGAVANRDLPWLLLVNGVCDENSEAARVICGGAAALSPGDD